MGLGKKDKKRKVKVSVSKAGDLKINPRNPRKVTSEKLTQLGKSMDFHGDISGVVFNRKTGVLIGGNQRSTQFDKSSEVHITKRYEKPTKAGTVAEGYITHNGENFSYREVVWSEARQTAAMIAANKNAGVFDNEELSKQIAELASFDVGEDIDLGLTMFDEGEIEAILPAAPDEDGEEETPGNEKEPLEKGKSIVRHECPRCGYTFN